MMNLKWCRLLAVVPLVGILVGTNVYQDPANIYHDENKEIAKAIVEGNNVIITSNLNERDAKHNLIVEMPDEVDTIAVGPSLAMCINEDIVGTESFYNLGVGGADLYDILAQFGTIELLDKKVNRVIICVDSYTFDEQFYDAEGALNMSLRPYADYMMSLLEGEKPEALVEDENEVNTMLNQAFSLSYFQASCAQVISNSQFIMSDYRWMVLPEGEETDRAYYGPDGSWNYSLTIRSLTLDSLKADAASYDIKKQFAYERHASEYSKETFEKLIVYLQEQGVEVELYLCPLAPSLWDRLEMEKEHYYILDELEMYAHQLAQKYNLQITGSYNPYSLGMSDKDFYDSRHVRRECLDTYFEFRR